jgi:hypothetical protein
MRRLWLLAAAVAAALAVTTAAWAAGSQTYFNGSLINGSYATSSYDNSLACGWWYSNIMYKPSWAWGIIAMIDTGGSWRYSYQQSGNIGIDIHTLNYAWTKKLLCKNNMSGYGTVYNATCVGYHDLPPGYQCV